MILKMLVTHYFIPSWSNFKSMHLGKFRRFIELIGFKPAFSGDMQTKCVMSVFIMLGMTFSFLQHNMYVENYHGTLLLLETLMLVMYEDFSIFGPMFAMSIHACDLGIYNLLGKPSSSMLLFYYSVYVFFYYICTMMVLRPMIALSEKSKTQALTSIHHQKRVSPAANTFLHRYETYIAYFYCVDIPVGTTLALKGDAGTLAIIKYQGAVKLGLALYIAFRALKTAF